jgi:hypothetical protein
MGRITEKLKKALTSTDAAALIPYDLEETLDEELIRLQPLAELLNIDQAEGKTHEYQIRTSHPQGWFEGETTPANPKKGTYVRKSVALKISRIWGQVTGFTQAVTERFINALATELEGSVQGMADLLEYGVLWGCADDIGFTGDAYQYSGIIPRLFAYADENVFDGGGDKIALDDLDLALERLIKWRQTRRDPKLWFMSLRMKQIIDGLQTKVQLPLQGAELAEGRLSMAAYGDTPILESDYFTPGASSPADLGATEDDGNGTLAADQYFYNISSVTIYGECVQGAEANVTTVGGGDAVDLTWTADANAVLYLIWRGLATGEVYLLDIIPALTYDGEGTVNGTVATYKDTGAKTPSSYVQPLLSGEQSILLINRNPNRGASLIGLIDDMGDPIDRLMSLVELARVKDTYDYMIKSYLTLKLKYPNLVAMVRHVKLAA